MIKNGFWALMLFLAAVLFLVVAIAYGDSRPVPQLAHNSRQIQNALAILEYNRLNSPKDNLTATREPTTTDDETEGYSSRSIWRCVDDVGSDCEGDAKVFFCTDATRNNATWQNLDDSGLGISGNAWTSILADGSGSATAKADSSNDLFSIVGGTGIEVVSADGTPETLTFTVVPGDINLADLGTKALANLTDVASAAQTNGFVLYSTGGNYTGAQLSHTLLGDIGAQTHADIDGHIAASNPHGTALNDISDVSITAVGDNELLAYNSGTATWINQTAIEAAVAPLSHSHAAAAIISGTLAHERGGLELDISSITTGDVLAGASAGVIEIVTASGHSDGDLLTLQADGTADWEVASGGDAFITINCPVGTDPVASGADTLNLASADTKLTITGDSGTDTVTIAVIEDQIDHDALTNFASDEHVAHSGVTLTAGNGLSGGGTIASSRIFNLDITELTADASPDGAADYVATYDGDAGSHKKVLLNDLPGGGGGLNNIVEDTTPQLGGDLDVNGQSILFADDEKIRLGNSQDVDVYFDPTLNFLTIKNTVSTSGIKIQSTGTASLILSGNSVGKLTLSGGGGGSSWPLGQGSSGQFLQTNGAGVLNWATASGTGTMTTVKSDGSQVGGSDIVTLDFSSAFTVTETPDTEINISLPNAISTADTFADFSVPRGTSAGDKTLEDSELLVKDVTGSFVPVTASTGNRLYLIGGDAANSLLRLESTSNGTPSGDKIQFWVRSFSEAVPVAEFDSDSFDLETGVALNAAGGVAVTGNITVSGTVDGVDVANHDARHITGGSDEIDGDKLDIDWSPSNYTPSTTPTEADSADNLTAHLYGVDQVLADARKHVKYIAVENPAASDEFVIAFCDVASTVTHVWGECDPGSLTVTFNIEERALGSATAVGTDVMTSDLVADSTGEDSTTFSNSAIAAESYLVVTVTSVTGSPTTFEAMVSYTED